MNSMAAGLATGCGTSSSSPSEAERLERIGLGLFTIPHRLQESFADSMKRLAEIGYKEIEFFGPYAFSSPEAHETWKPIAEALGFSQSGYFGLTPAEARRVLDDNGLTSPSIHTDMETLRTQLGPLAEAAHDRATILSFRRFSVRW